MHATQTGAVPEVSQSGAPAPQPVSVPVPAASSTHATHMGPVVEPLHTPPAQVAPAGAEACASCHNRAVAAPLSCLGGVWFSRYIKTGWPARFEQEPSV